MMIALIVGVLLIVLGFLWGKRINDGPSNDGDMAQAVFAVLVILLGAAVVVITLLVLLVRHVPWGWS